MTPDPDLPHLPRHAAQRLAVLLAAFAFTAAAFAQQARKPQNQSAPLDLENAEIVQLEHLWLHAEDTGNISELDEVLASDFLCPAPAAGEFITKPEMIAFFRKHPASHPSGTSTQFTQLRVRLYGNVAIARGILTTSDAQGTLLRKTLFTDVFVLRQGRWQAVSAQENVVPRH